MPSIRFDAINGKDDFLEDLQKTVVDATLGPIIGELEDWMKDLASQVEDGLAEGYLREVNGPLIYAENISVGENSNARLMAGMLVAKNSITIGTRDFVGSLTCLEGDITARNVLFAPYFTQASLYKPKNNGSGLLGPTDWEYGTRADSGAAGGIRTGVNMVRTQGWSR